jgi:hypothetical protein
VRDENDATTVAVAPDQEIDLGLMTLVERALVPVRLEFPDDDPRGASSGPIPGNNRTIVFRGGGFVTMFGDGFWGQAFPDNSFDVAFVPGTYEIMAVWRQDGRKGYGTPMTFVVAGEEVKRVVEPVALEVVKIDVNTVIDDLSGEPADSETTEDLECRLDDGGWWSFPICEEGAAARGTYDLLFGDLPPGTYVTSATIEGTSVLDRPVEIHGPTVIDIVLGTPGTRVDGFVRDSDGIAVPHAVVALIPDDARSPTDVRYRAATSDVRGKFDIGAIGLGTYMLHAWPDLPGAAYRNAEFMTSFEGLGTRIDVDGSGSLRMDLVAH